MRALGLLILLASGTALAAGPMVLPSPDLRALSAGPMVSQSRDTATTTCIFRPGFTQCSDGRTITTTRASAVPCETAPGVWTYAPAGQACVSVRGLESWGATTNYIPHPNALETWTESGSASMSALTGETGIRIIKGDTSGYIRAFDEQRLSVESGETWTYAFDARGVDFTGGSIRSVLGGGVGCSLVNHSAPSDWARFTASCSIGTTGEAYLQIDRASATPGTWDIRHATLAKGSTVGARPCWAEDGSAPFTCEADVHTISTEGFPTDEGSITLSVTWGEAGARQRGLIDGLTIETNGAIKQGSVTSSALTWTVGQTYRVEMRREGGTVSLHRDGVEVASGASAAWSWGATATLGGTGATALSGGIGMLRLK